MKGFYWYFRPIALGFKIFGIFPLDNVLDLNTSNLKFRLASSSHMYSTLILISFSAMIYYFCGFIFSLSSYAEVVISYVIYGMIGRTVGCFLVYGFKKYHELPTLIQLLDSFDKQKKEIVIPQCYSKKTLVSRTIAPSVMIILFLIITLKLSAGVIFSALPNELRNQKNAMLYCYVFAYLMNRGLLPSLLYIYFAHTINYGFKEINNTLYQKQIIPSYYNDIKYPSDMHMILTKVRFLHNVLAECVTKLSTVFGSFMAIDQFGVVVVFVINVSVYIYLRTQFINLLTLTMANAFLVGWVLFISHEIQKNASVIIDLLHGIPLEEIDEKSISEILLIHQQFAAKPIQISAGGHFILNRGQLITLFAAVAHYLVVTMQIMDNKVHCLTNNGTSKLC